MVGSCIKKGWMVLKISWLCSGFIGWKQHFQNIGILLFWGLLAVVEAFGSTRPFDDADYSLDASLSGGPMSTIAGLTEWARDINHVYGITTIVVILVFFAVSIPLLIAVSKFRVREADLKDLKPPKQVHGNAALEFTWTIIPVILLFFIAVPTWEVIFKQPDQAPPGAMKVKVIGHQWWWEFQYPDLGITTANELHLPQKTPVYFEISSADVIHSFWIPQFGGKVDALPGPGVENYLYYVTPPMRNPGLEGGGILSGTMCRIMRPVSCFDEV